MHSRIPHAWLTAAAMVLGGAACSFPTDKSEQVFVTIALTSPVVLRGEVIGAVAQLWHRVSPTDSVELHNTSFMWFTDRTVATIDPSGGGFAEITGVRTGSVLISARAVAFENSQSGSANLRVSDPLEIDSIVPDTVRYGAKLRIHGVGVRNIFIATIGSGALIPDTFSFQGDREGLGSMAFWVPPPSRTSDLFVLGPGVFFSRPETTVVRPFDIHEPNETSPWQVNLDLAGPFPQVPQVLFFNPALAFERLPRDDSLGADWYRFRQTATRDLSIIIVSGEARGTFATFVSDSLGFQPPPNPTHFIGSDAWTFGPGSHFCHGAAFEPKQLGSDSTIVALRGMPAGTLDALSIYAQEAPYAMFVVNGYVTSGKMTADPHEEDDFCTAAGVGGPQPQLKGLFTIDNPGDVDWFRFDVPGPGATPVRFRLEPAAAAAVDTTNDIDLYVAQVPAPADPVLAIVGQSTNVGSREDATFVLGPGPYYLIVVDFAAVPMAYAMCYEVSASVFCNTLPLAVASASPPPGPKARPTRRAPWRVSPSAPR